MILPTICKLYISLNKHCANNSTIYDIPTFNENFYSILTGLKLENIAAVNKWNPKELALEKLMAQS